MQTAQLKMYEKKTLPLGLGHDFDVQTSGVAYWDGTSGSSSTSNCTPTKITTEAHVLPGFEQALLLTNSAAGGYSRSEVITVSPSQPVYVGVLLKLGAGTSARGLFLEQAVAAISGAGPVPPVALLGGDRTDRRAD